MEESKEDEKAEIQEALIKRLASIKHLLTDQEIIDWLKRKRVETDILIRVLKDHRTEYDVLKEEEEIKHTCLLGLLERDEPKARKAIFETAYLDKGPVKEMASEFINKDVKSFSSLIKEYLISK